MSIILEHEVFHLGLSPASFQQINFRVEKALRFVPSVMQELATFKFAFKSILSKSYC